MADLVDVGKPPSRDAGVSDKPRHWRGHVIVCGLHDVGFRTVEQLQIAGARVVVLDDEVDERLTRLIRGWGIPMLSLIHICA